MVFHPFTRLNKWTSRDDNTKKDFLLKQKERMRLGNNWGKQINCGGMLAIANDRMKAYQTEMQQSEASKQLLYLVFFLKRKINQYKNILYN